MAKITDLTREAVLTAVQTFDANYRDSPDWQSWQDNKAYKFALQIGGLRYPVKTIVSLASSIPVSEFSGGKGRGQANEVLENLGFEVVQIHGRNPPWSRDELILALDLYLRHRDQPPGKSSDEVIELSETLNRLAHAVGRHGESTLRNLNGVYMKMMNFRSLDPEYTVDGRVGLSRGGKLDDVVWQEFSLDPEHCQRVAESIRQAVSAADDLLEWQDDADDIEEAEEGRILTVLHRRRERNRKIVASKKKAVMQQAGKLACEVCGFNFSVVYGERGNGFIECHHTGPLSEGAGQKTKLHDLVLVCANCHRMIHAKKPWLTIDELRKTLDR